MARPFLFDMETGDPDDVLTLLLLIGHPEVDLVGVTITPGTPHQVGVVRHVLDRFDMGHLPVGAFNLDHKKNSPKGPPTCVSDWHYKVFGEIPSTREAAPGWEVLYDNVGRSSSLITGAPTLVTGAALKNVGAFLGNWQRWDGEIGLSRLMRPSFGRIFIQGGFAGEGVVAPEKQLAKFKGQVTCPTYNLNGDPKAALAVLACHHFTERRFVSKNVCHGVIYDEEMQGFLRSRALPHPALELLVDICPVGKKLHDPLAACCAIDPTIGEWAEVEVYRKKGEWGSRLSPNSGTRIIVDYDRDKFLRTLAGEVKGG